MTHTEMLSGLQSTGIPFVAAVWKSPPPLPYGVLLTPRSNNMSADGVAYQTVQRYEIELYSVGKDSESEAKIETALTEQGVFYEKYETWIDSERVYQTAYECEV